MRAKRVWIGGAAFLVLVAVLLIFRLEVGYIVSGLFLGTDNPYRVAGAVEVADRHQVRKSVVFNDCESFEVNTWNTGRYTALIRRGEDNHIVLGDKSILVFIDLEPCQARGERPVIGATYVLDPLLPAEAEARAEQGGRVKLWASFAWRFDSTEDPKTVTVYDFPGLFRSGDDGLKIEQVVATIVDAEAAETAIGYTLEKAFPWFADVPRAEAGDQSYGDLYHHGNFLGFRALVLQLPNGTGCAGLEASGDKPILVPTDHPCAVIDTLPDGWLIGSVGPDFSRVSFSLRDTSRVRIGTYHREVHVAAAEPPGSMERADFRWRPLVCVDGVCAEGETGTGIIERDTVFHYPQSNQLVRVRPTTFYAANAFRRMGAAK